MNSTYNQGKIYRLLLEDGHYYIGSTTQPLPQRLNVKSKKNTFNKIQKVYMNLKKSTMQIIRKNMQNIIKNIAKHINREFKQNSSNGVKKKEKRMLNKLLKIVKISSNSAKRNRMHE